jgi:hypothetical protein
MGITASFIFFFPHAQFGQAILPTHHTTTIILPAPA